MHVALDGTPQPPRHLQDILSLIHASALPMADRERGDRVFRTLAAAEAAVHGTSVEQVHFHEVGAVDAIVDVMGAIVGLRLLGVDACYASALPAGSGTARSEHGEIPVPAPATLQLLAQAHVPMSADAGERGELVTPTGAALLTTLAEFTRPALTIERVGYGAGGRDPAGRPNVLRLWLGRGDAAAARPLLQMETNIDDLYARRVFRVCVQERLFVAGALDVWFSPIQMKKNRPGTLLGLICRPEHRSNACRDLLLREKPARWASAFGRLRRHEAEREILRFESSLGERCRKSKAACCRHKRRA